MIKKILLGSLGLVVLLCAGGALFLYFAVNKDIDEHYAGVCTDLPLPGSGEDMQLDRERGFAYLSVYDRGAVASGEIPDPGTIMRIDLNADELDPVSALLDGPTELRPHGITLFIDAEGNRSLLVINHPIDREGGQERIERFMEESPGAYRHVETFTSPLITRANDLVATGPREFYVAQDIAQGSGEAATKLVYFNGEEFIAVADDIESGGGINVSNDNSVLYIAETNAKAIRVARRNPEDGSIETIRRIELESSPDNINVNEDGSLTVGAHSNLVALVMHFIMGADAPTQVLRVDAAGGADSVEEIYLNGGSELSAGSGAVSSGNRLLIGSITAKKILVCEADEPERVASAQR